MCDHTGCQKVSSRSRDVFLNQAVVWTFCIDDCLQILFAAIYRNQERSLSTAEYRSCEYAFVYAPLLRRTNQRKRVARIQMSIAKCEIETAVEFGFAGFGCDFD